MGIVGGLRGGTVPRAVGANVTERYLEDFEVGQTFGSGRLTVDSNRIKAFAAEFDPQPFHLDDKAARGSIFGELAASGWHTAALTMRLLVEGELKPAGGIVGVGFDELRWPLPVLPGDELQVESEILEVRPSQSRPNQGLIKVKTTTRNQHGQAVQIAVGNLIVPRRPDQARPGPARALTLEFNEHINNRNLSGLAALMTDDHTFIDSAEHAIRGKSNCLDAWREFFASFPDYRNVFERLIAHEDSVVVVGRSVCSDARLDGPALWVAKITNGKVAEWRVYEDTAASRLSLDIDSGE